HNLGHRMWLVPTRILAGRVEGLDRRGVGKAAARVDPEVVADEARGVADAVEPRRGELRVPAMRGESDVVTDRTQLGAIELNRRVDAVVRAPVGRARIEAEASNDGLERVARGAGESPVVECDRDGRASCRERV